MSITIGRWSFKTKRAAEDYIRGILARYGQRQPLAGADLEFAQALLQMHPNRDAIVDVGVKRIEVQHLLDAHDARRLLVVRVDHSIRDFTWRHALSPRDARQSVMRACRVAIADQIQEFRSCHFSDGQEKTCPLRGIRITAGSSHIDHEPPNTFENLVARWLQINRLTYSDVELAVSREYETPTRFADDFLEANWKEFHQENAVLRVLSSAANVSDSRMEARDARSFDQRCVEIF